MHSMPLGMYPEGPSFQVCPDGGAARCVSTPAGRSAHAGIVYLASRGDEFMLVSHRYVDVVGVLALVVGVVQRLPTLNRSWGDTPLWFSMPFFNEGLRRSRRSLKRNPQRRLACLRRPMPRLLCERQRWIQRSGPRAPCGAERLACEYTCIAKDASRRRWTCHTLEDDVGCALWDLGWCRLARLCLRGSLRTMGWLAYLLVVRMPFVSHAKHSPLPTRSRAMSPGDETSCRGHAHAESFLGDDPEGKALDSGAWALLHFVLSPRAQRLGCCRSCLKPSQNEALAVLWAVCDRALSGPRCRCPRRDRLPGGGSQHGSGGNGRRCGCGRIVQRWRQQLGRQRWPPRAPIRCRCRGNRCRHDAYMHQVRRTDDVQGLQAHRPEPASQVGQLLREQQAQSRAQGEAPACYGPRGMHTHTHPWQSILCLRQALCRAVATCPCWSLCAHQGVSLTIA